KLTWTPPGYPSYSGYTTINLTDSLGGRHVGLTAGVDYRIVFPNTALTGKVYLLGGRNIVIIGGEIHMPDNPQTTLASAVTSTSATTITVTGDFVNTPS